MTDFHELLRDYSSSEGSATGDRQFSPAISHNRSEVVSDITEMLERQLVVYSAHRLAALAERLGMPLNDVKALEIITAFESVSTGQLAQMLGVSSGGVTALINRLEVAGHVIRGHHPLDRRIIVIQPNPASRQQLTSRPALASEHVDRSACRYDIDQLETVQTFLSQCARLLKDETTRWMETKLDSHH
jgi:DNA-binding MarR family transcriptional regulator